LGARLTSWELWAVAHTVLKQHGDKAPLFVAERLGGLALAGDLEGVNAWREIARRIDQLSPRRPPN